MKKLLYISLFLILAIAGCKRVEKVNTYQVILNDINATTEIYSAQISASYTYEYSLKTVKIIYAENEKLDGTSSIDASFTSNTVTAEIGGLKPNTSYFYKFEFNNGITKMWSEVKYFKTLEAPVSAEFKITTNEVTEIEETSALCGGEVSYNGSDTVIKRGVCWAISENPTLENCTDTTLNGGGTGKFTSHIKRLKKNTTYYVKAYATNSDTTVYGEQKTFTTFEHIVYSRPTVVTYDVDETTITQYSAILSGAVTDNGNYNITGCGFWYNTTHDTIGGIFRPTTYNDSVFSLNVSDSIEPWTTYFARAYTEYGRTRCLGNEVSFVTKRVIVTPTITTTIPHGTSSTSALSGGNVTDDGGATVTARGVCWNTTGNPSLTNCIDYTSDGTGTGIFTSAMTGLEPNITYYLKAYATNSVGTNYGEQAEFETVCDCAENYVDLGLPSGLLWASCNVDACIDEDQGGYYAWGETMTKDNYLWSTYKWCNGSYTNLTKYNTNPNYGIVDNITVIEEADDAAHTNWGDGWRMPTIEDWKELFDNTQSVWTTQNDVYGRLLISTVQGYTDKSLFLPAAGYYLSEQQLYSTKGYYWSSSLDTLNPQFAYRLLFDSDTVKTNSMLSRNVGCTIRPVRSSK